MKELIGISKFYKLPAFPRKLWILYTPLYMLKSEITMKLLIQKEFHYFERNWNFSLSSKRMFSTILY